MLAEYALRDDHGNLSVADTLMLSLAAHDPVPTAKGAAEDERIFPAARPGPPATASAHRGTVLPARRQETGPADLAAVTSVRPGADGMVRRRRRRRPGGGPRRYRRRRPRGADTHGQPPGHHAFGSDPARLDALERLGGGVNPYTFIPTLPRDALPPGLGDAPPGRTGSSTR